jgi:hypothetical protein
MVTRQRRVRRLFRLPRISLLRGRLHQHVMDVLAAVHVLVSNQLQTYSRRKRPSQVNKKMITVLSWDRAKPLHCLRTTTLTPRHPPRLMTMLIATLMDILMVQ